MPERAYLSIGEVLSLLRPEFPDLTISKIRFLESQGLLDPERTPSGYRKFYEHDVERLRWILRQQREQYLPLKVIKGRLGMDVTDDLDNEEGTDASGTGHPAGAALGHPGSNDPGANEQPTARPPPDGATTSVPSVPSTPAVDETFLRAGASGVSLRLDELAAAAGLSAEDLADLRRYGLISGRPAGGTTYYDEEDLVVANLAAAFMRFGVEARHLRMYKTASEREAAFFEQLVMPMVKQRNPKARQEAQDSLVELARLGQGLRNAMLRQALREHLGH